MHSLFELVKRSERFLLPVLALATLAVFSPVLWHDFVAFDDDVFVYANQYVSSGLTVDVVRWAFSSGHEANWIPLSILSHALDIQLFGLNPAGHHAVNLLLHTSSSCLWYIFLKRATGAPWKSAAVAFLFALHPLRVESVAWVAERKDVLSMFFGVLTIILYLLYTEKETAGRYCATLGCYVLGLLSKPMLVTLPLVLLLLDWWPIGRSSFCSESRRATLQRGLPHLLLEKIPFVICSIISSVITYRVQQVVGELPQGYTFVSRLGKSCIAYLTYLYKMLWPVDLAVLYPFSKYPPSTAAISWAFVTLLLITVAVVWYGKRQPYLVTGWFWYLITLLPVIGLIQIGQHSVADRYTYLPLTGIFIALVWGGAHLAERMQLKNHIVGIGAGFLIVLLSILTFLQLRHWKNSETLFSHALHVTEGNWVMHSNLGLVYLNQGRIDEAIWQFNQSIKAKPSYSLAYLNLGAAYVTIKQYDKALDAFKWSLQFDPSNLKARFGLGAAYLGHGDRARAMAEYRVLRDAGDPSADGLLEMIVNSAGGGAP